MTIINYKINNQTSRDLTANDWASAQTLQAQTQAEEIAQFQWWKIVAVITNNDNTITMTGVDENGVPQSTDEEGNPAPYIDITTTANK